MGRLRGRGHRGTTNLGLSTTSPGLAAVCRERAVAARRRRLRPRRAVRAERPRPLRGIEHADSLIVDPHKWLFAPFDCCALIYREPRGAAPRTARPPATSTRSTATGVEPVGLRRPPDPPGRGLPFWFSLAVHGTDAYTEAVERTLAVTRAARGVRAPPRARAGRRAGALGAPLPPPRLGGGHTTAGPRRCSRPAPPSCCRPRSGRRPWSASRWSTRARPKTTSRSCSTRWADSR